MHTECTLAGDIPRLQIREMAANSVKEYPRLPPSFQQLSVLQVASQNQCCTVQCVEKVDIDTWTSVVWLPRSIIWPKTDLRSNLNSKYFQGWGGRGWGGGVDPQTPSCCMLMYTLNSNLTTSNLMASTTAPCMYIQPLCCRNKASYQYCHMDRSHSKVQVAGGSIYNTGGTVATTVTIENYALFLLLFFLCAYCCLCSVHSVRSQPETSPSSRENPCWVFFVMFCFCFLWHTWSGKKRLEWVVKVN